jgi:hypothetical protein
MYIINLVRTINLHFAIPPPEIPSDYLCNPLSTITFHVMSTTPNLQALIAHYLASNYPSVLPAFLEATHVPEPDLENPPRPDLPSLVTEFFAIQASIDLSNVKIDDHEISHDGSWKGWTARQAMKVELPAEVRLGGVRRTLEGISAANLLTVGVQKVPKRVFDTSIAGYVLR